VRGAGLGMTLPAVSILERAGETLGDYLLAWAAPRRPCRRAARRSPAGARAQGPTRPRGGDRPAERPACTTAGTGGAPSFAQPGLGGRGPGRARHRRSGRAVANWTRAARRSDQRAAALPPEGSSPAGARAGRRGAGQPCAAARGATPTRWTSAGRSPPPLSGSSWGSSPSWPWPSSASPQGSSLSSPRSPPPASRSPRRWRSVWAAASSPGTSAPAATWAARSRLARRSPIAATVVRSSRSRGVNGARNRARRERADTEPPLARVRRPGPHPARTGFA
jgi:hypothetical protein